MKNELRLIGLFFVIAVVWLSVGAWQDIYNQSDALRLLSPDTTSIDVTCDSVDTRGYTGGVMLFVDIGPGASFDSLTSAMKLEAEVEESTGNGSWTDVADADLYNWVAGTNDGCFAVADTLADMSTLYWTQYKGTKRYIRPVINATGDFTNGVRVSAFAVGIGTKYKGSQSDVPTLTP